MIAQTPERQQVVERLELIASEEFLKRQNARPNSVEYFEANRKYADAKFMADAYRKHEENIFGERLT